MTYVPKPDGHNHNISHESPLHEFARVAAVFTLVIVVLFGSAALFADLMVSHITPKQEAFVMRHLKLAQGRRFSKGPATDYLNAIVGRLITHDAQTKADYTVTLSCDQSPNAYALPGGMIVVTSGLQESVKSENGLAFVLAHELGHFHNRDHLRSVSRQLLFAILGSSLGVAKVDAFVPLLVDLSFSRDQERRADEYGASLVRSEYGHLNGSSEFFEFILKNHPLEARMPGFVSSHPVTGERLRELNVNSASGAAHDKRPLQVDTPWSRECVIKI